MRFRYPTRPLYPVLDELDRLYEQTPANERGLFPLSFAGPAGPAEHLAATADDPLLLGGSRTGAPNSKLPRRVNAEAA